jgi:hypothetical protein
MKFDMSEAWREAMAMIAANREVLLVVAGIFFFLPTLLLGLTMPDFRGLMSADTEVAQAQMFDFYSDYWWLFLLAMIASMVGYLALLALLRDHSRPTVGQAMRSGVAGVFPAIGAYLVFFVIAFILILAAMVVAGLSGSAAVSVVIGLACMIGLIYLGIKFALSAPVIAIEKIYNPFAVLARSWRLTRGNSFRLFLFFLLILIVYFVLSMVGGIVTAALLFALGEAAYTMISGLLSALISAVLAVVVVAVLASVHRQLSGVSPERLGETFE